MGTTGTFMVANDLLLFYCPMMRFINQIPYLLSAASGGYHGDMLSSSFRNPLGTCVPIDFVKETDDITLYFV